MRVYNVPVNQSVLTEANRGLTSYTFGTSGILFEFLCQVYYDCLLLLLNFDGISKY
jgi:hypothetical protein